MHIVRAWPNTVKRNKSTRAFLIDRTPAIEPMSGSTAGRLRSVARQKGVVPQETAPFSFEDLLDCAARSDKGRVE
jgi:hypothetical protein